tara:strand:+ start:4364 stop:4504 length:141 start_codon:yes stop_codon:yes gene_type:complete
MTKFISLDKEAQEKKETVFTHYVCDVQGWVNSALFPKDFKKIIYKL